MSSSEQLTLHRTHQHMSPTMIRFIESLNNGDFRNKTDFTEVSVNTRIHLGERNPEEIYERMRAFQQQYGGVWEVQECN